MEWMATIDGQRLYDKPTSQRLPRIRESPNDVRSDQINGIARETSEKARKSALRWKWKKGAAFILKSAAETRSAQRSKSELFALQLLHPAGEFLIYPMLS